MLERELEKRITLLHSEGKWKEIIALGESDENHEACRLLWVWPTLDDLNWIKNVIEDYNLRGIVSIGCGTGLLEWIIQQHSHCHMIGLEVDRSWWTSKYSPPFYLDKIIFIDTEHSINIPENYIFLFCYFNDGEAFNNYLITYTGKILLIIGPGNGYNRCTDPLPFDTKLIKFGWKLDRSRKLDNGKDYITVYTKP